MDTDKNSARRTGRNALAVALTALVLASALALAPATAQAQVVSNPDNIQHELLMPLNFVINRNNKRTYKYTHRDWTAWQYSTTYVCGVKGRPSTHATYSFKKIPSSGYYELYAYYPGHVEHNGRHKNDGHGVYKTYVNSERIRTKKENNQFGGWRRIRFADWWDLTEKYGRDRSANRWLSREDRLVVEIHNGGYRSEGKNGQCGSSRTVFPPLLLVKIDDAPNVQPYSPAHDMHPQALSLFYECWRTTDVRTLEDTFIDFLVHLESTNSWPIGPANTLKGGRNYNNWIGKIFRCEILVTNAAPYFWEFGYWGHAHWTFNFSHDALLDFYHWGDRLVNPRVFYTIIGRPERNNYVELPNGLRFVSSEGIVWMRCQPGKRYPLHRCIV